MPQFKFHLACFIKHDMVVERWDGGNDGKQVEQEQSTLKDDTNSIIKMTQQQKLPLCACVGQEEVLKEKENPVTFLCGQECLE